MQKEIKKRASLYGITAVLLAIALATLCYNFGVNMPEFKSSIPSFSLLKTFESENELRTFLKTNSETQGPFVFLGSTDLSMPGPVREYAESSANQFVTAPGFSQASAQALEYEHSITNIQVAGVDEADIVKTDGEYMYIVSGNRVYILKAYPADEAEVVSEITFNETYPVEIFVSRDRLAVLGCKYWVPSPVYYGCFIVDVKTFVDIYDISNRTNPTFLTNCTMTGSYFNSRMIGDYVYFVVSQPAYVIYDTVILPKIYTKDGMKEISPTEIHYHNASSNYYMYTTIVAVNMQNASEEPNYEPILTGGTSSMYVSLNNMYITFPEIDGQTSIYRIRLENRTINSEAQGKVLGGALNQFSMDEYNNHLRIATTTSVNGNAQNNLYVLDINLSIVGRLENITQAFNERIDSARFIGNRCYLATSVVRKDPFFVIDVENATEPKVLGYLKIPGFTRYLHPYDENHIIGIGRDENNSIKISLFDVTNVSAPVEIDMYAVEGIWSDTPVLWDHKAFLFDKSKNLLAIPLFIYDYSVEKYWQWQGVYVFNVTLSEGIALRGNVTHLMNNDIYFDSSYWAKRTLYIENVLYTVSDKKVKMNSLEDLSFIKDIELS